MSSTERTSGAPADKNIQHACIEGAHLFTGSAAKVGTSFLGRIFSGHESKRLDLGGSTDPTHRLGIKILGEKKTDNTQEKNWGFDNGCVPIYIKNPGDPESKVTVLAVEIASLSARLGMNKEDILLLAKTGNLETKINEKIKEYQSDKEVIGNLKKDVSKILNDKRPSEQKIGEIKQLIETLSLNTKDSLTPLYILQRDCKSEKDLDKLDKKLNKFYEELHKLMSF